MGKGFSNRCHKIFISHQKKKKFRKELHNYSKFMCKKKDTRTVQKSWLLANSELFDCLAPNVNANEFDAIESKFYLDQKDLRIMFLSEEIDLDYERDRERRMNQITEANNCVEAEWKFVFDQDEENNISIDSNTSIHSTQLEPKSNISLSMTRSGVCRVTCTTRIIAIQTDLYKVLQPPVRKVKVCMEEI